MINKPATRTYFTAHGPDATHMGVTEPEQVTTTGQPQMLFDADAEAYAAKVQDAGLINALPLLPSEGEEVVKDRVYNHNGTALVAYQTHTRTHFIPTETPALFGVAKAKGDPWVQPLGAHDAYGMGAEVLHNGNRWRSINAANVWEPGVFGWEEIV